MILFEEVTGMNDTHDPLEGYWQGYKGEWGRVSRQLVALSEAIPEDKFNWRPAEGILSIKDVITHTALTNYYLLKAIGQPFPTELKTAVQDNTIATKNAVIHWLKRSLEAVQSARATTTEAELGRAVQLLKRDSTVDAVYLRIIIHAYEHMGQLIAYARINGVTPPWSEQK